MFCDGKCERRGKVCGLLTEVLMQNDRGEPRPVKKCIFLHLLDSSLRQEAGQVRVQAAVESARNVSVDNANALKEVVRNVIFDPRQIEITPSS